MDIAGPRRKIRRSRRDPTRIGIGERIVIQRTDSSEAVARIKVVLHTMGVIKTAKVRRPQLGISEGGAKAAARQLRVLKRNEFRSAETGAESKRRQAVA